MENNSTNNAKVKKKYRPFYNFWYDFIKVTGAIPVLIWLRPKVYYPFGKPHTKGPILISSNHPTMFDPVTVLAVFPTRRLNSLATKDLYTSKFKTFMFNQMHCIMVDKSNFSVSSFHEVINRLNDGKAVLIFPEGQVNREESMLAFKSGAILMAHKSGAPILPMYIVKREKWYHRQRVIMGQTINVSEMLGRIPSMQQLTEVSDLLRDNEQKLREYYESLPIYKKMNSSATITE